MTTEVDALIDHYLKDLEAQLGDLPAGRQELLAEIAAEARERFGVQPRPPAPATPWLEVAAIVLLVIPFIGWVVGVVLVWLSRRWTTGDKLVGTFGGFSWVLGGLGMVMAEVTSTPLAQSGSDSPVGQVQLDATGPSLVEVILVAAPFVQPVAAAIYLGFRLRRSTAS